MAPPDPVRVAARYLRADNRAQQLLEQSQKITTPEEGEAFAKAAVYDPLYELMTVKSVLDDLEAPLEDVLKASEALRALADPLKASFETLKATWETVHGNLPRIPGKVAKLLPRAYARLVSFERECGRLVSNSEQGSIWGWKVRDVKTMMDEVQVVRRALKDLTGYMTR